MREIVARAGDGDETARLALDVYLHRMRAGIASMAAALGGLDVLVFTGGVGEHQPDIRAGAVRGMDFLGVAIDDHMNAGTVPDDREITAAGMPGRVLVIRAREDLEIARQARAVLGRPPG
jgi:acetate kinase